MVAEALDLLRRVAWGARVGAVAALALAACTRTGSDEPALHVYDAYDGGAPYPNRRPKLDRGGHLAGFTSDNGSDTVSVLDLVTGERIGSAPVGRDPVDNDGPHHLAVDGARGEVFVALSYPAPAAAPGPHAAHGSSARSGFVQRLALDDLRVLGEVRVDPNPGDIVESADGKRIVVTHFDLKKALVADAGVEGKRANVVVIDPDAVLASGSPDPLRIPTCIAPHGVALSRPDGKTAFVACYGEDSIAIVDLADPAAEIVRVPVGPGAGPPGAPIYGPYSAVMSPSGKKIAIGSTEKKDVRLLDVDAQAMDALVVKTIGAPYFVAWTADDTTMFVPTQSPDALVVADAATGAIVTTRSFQGGECEKPHEADLSPDGQTLYVVCEGDHVGPGAVNALDPATLETKATFPVGVYPDRLAILEAK